MVKYQCKFFYLVPFVIDNFSYAWEGGTCVVNTKKLHSQIDAYEEENLKLQSEKGLDKKRAWFDE